MPFSFRAPLSWTRRCYSLESSLHSDESGECHHVRVDTTKLKRVEVLLHLAESANSGDDVNGDTEDDKDYGVMT